MLVPGDPAAADRAQGPQAHLPRIETKTHFIQVDSTRI